MQILIDIPEKDYNAVKEFVTGDQGRVDYMAVFKAIESGTPLPKGHGRLIDTDWVLDKMDNADASLLPRTINEYYAWNFAQVLLTQAPTIIEADKENVGEE